MELVKLNDENSFDPTPKLKSSPVPIFFASFNWEDKNCFHCGEEYETTIYHHQSYCKKCLSSYLTNITDNNMYLDVYLNTKELECNKHEVSRTKVPQNIQECCKNCLTILCFKQIAGYYFYLDMSSVLYKNLIESDKYCKLCEKLLYKETVDRNTNEIILCSSCYLISSGCIESTFTKKFISIIYLPWWDDTSQCHYCDGKLVFTSNCQKYCMICYIFSIGCRYCLTTNMIFGYTNQSQCKKCKRISTITIDIRKIISGNSVLDDFLFSTRSYYQSAITKFIGKVKNIDKWFSSVITDSLYDDPQLDIYILVMDYAQKGDLHKYLRKNFTEINWHRKLFIHNYIVMGLQGIHDENFIHRDFHSGNVLSGCWDPDPKKRPSIDEIDDISHTWYRQNNHADQLVQADLIRKELIDSKKLGPEFSEKPHSKAIYTNYISEELKLDIDIESSGLNSLGIKRNIEELNINSCENNGKRIKN
ncbi:kinase-like domain-containing protein [Rhizophagus irregularis DAOM 181602=DAOM 197198]|nr:kinase-like domain-containing protein [Rhizophagus irregularis DAOM 181602=DAOM 197198]